MLATIGGIIGALVSALLMALLLRTVRPTARRSGSRNVLEYGTAMRVVGVIFFLLGGAFIYAASKASSDQQAIAWLVSGLLAAGGIYFFWEVLWVRIEFDDSFIYSFSPWRGQRKIAWTEIASVKFSEMNRWHVLCTRSQGKLRVSIYLSGAGSFLEKLASMKDLQNLDLEHL